MNMSFFALRSGVFMDGGTTNPPLERTAEMRGRSAADRSAETAITSQVDVLPETERD